MNTPSQLPPPPSSTPATAPPPSPVSTSPISTSPISRGADGVGAPSGAAGSGYRAARFVDVLRSEWIKIASLRASWIVPLAASILPVIVVVANAVFGSIDYPDLFGSVFVMMFIPLVAVNAFASTAVTSEYNHDTIRVTYAATPQRGRVVAAKYIASVTYATATFAATLAVCALVGAAIFSARGASDVLSGDEIASLGWMVFLAAGLCGISLALGYFIRNSAATVTVAAVYPLASTIIWSFVNASSLRSAAQWFPFAGAWSAVGDVSFDSSGSLGRPLAFVYLATVVAALALLAYLVELRRDA